MSAFVTLTDGYEVTKHRGIDPEGKGAQVMR